MSEYMTLVDRQARTASRDITRAGTTQRNRTLLHIAAAVRRGAAKLKEISARGVGHARVDGHDAAFIDHLTLADRATDTMAAGLKRIAALPDSIGGVSNTKFRPTSIRVDQMRMPLDVIGIIYESRPNVTVGAAALYIKSGSTTILRDGSEAIESDGALAALTEKGLAEVDLLANAVQVVVTMDRAAVGKLITTTECVDVIMPRSGRSLIMRLIEGARVPMIKHLNGIYHVYIGADTDIERTVYVCGNAKTQRYAPCNTVETLPMSRDVTARVLPPLTRVYQDKGVELRVCPATHTTLEAAGFDNLKGAVEADWHTEYLAPILSIRTADGLDAAIEHINAYGSAHTGSIIMENYSAGMRSLHEVDSASVMINTSTRFADGFEYGLGTKVGISNDKFHACGPVGLERLTSLKYVVLGHGEIRI